MEGSGDLRNWDRTCENGGSAFGGTAGLWGKRELIKCSGGGEFEEKESSNSSVAGISVDIGRPLV